MITIACPDADGKIYKLPKKLLIKRTALYGIFFRNEKVLLIKDSRSQKWELPGGGLEGNENEERCLSREFQEETGLLIITKGKRVESFHEYYFDSPSGKAWCTKRIFYLAEKVEGKIKRGGNQTEVLYVMFHPVSKLNNIPMAKRIRQTIYRAYNQKSARISTAQNQKLQLDIILT